MFSIHRMLFLALKKVQNMKITPAAVFTTSLLFKFHMKKNSDFILKPW